MPASGGSRSRADRRWLLLWPATPAVPLFALQARLGTGALTRAARCCLWVRQLLLRLLLHLQLGFTSDEQQCLGAEKRSACLIYRLELLEALLHAGSHEERDIK